VSRYRFASSYIIAVSSQWSCFGHFAQSLQTFIGSLLFSILANPSISKNLKKTRLQSQSENFINTKLAGPLNSLLNHCLADTAALSL